MRKLVKKISILVGVLLIIISCCGFTFVNAEKITLYDINGKTIEVLAEDADEYIKQNWYPNPVQMIYSLDNRTAIIYKSEFDTYAKQGWYSAPVKQLYNLKQESIIIYKDEVDKYLMLNWYLEPVEQIYNLKQESIVIYKKDFENYKALGWYNYPVMSVYDKMGNTIIIPRDQLQQYLNKGYYKDKPTVNYNDMVLLARVIHAEATQNPALRITDRRCVGAVVMNRVRHSRFPNTLQGVIYAPGQYSCVNTYYFNQTPPQECLDIAKQLLLGETFGVPSNVVFQAQFRQGKGVWKTVGVHYYCYI